jgi:hypothetical protein
MKGLKKIALASAIAAVSAGAQAELKALDDSAMGELTGQAGLTIDLNQIHNRRVHVQRRWFCFLQRHELER